MCGRTREIHFRVVETHFGFHYIPNRELDLNLKITTWQIVLNSVWKSFNIMTGTRENLSIWSSNSRKSVPLSGGQYSFCMVEHSRLRWIYCNVCDDEAAEYCTDAGWTVLCSRAKNINKYIRRKLKCRLHRGVYSGKSSCWTAGVKYSLRQLVKLFPRNRFFGSFLWRRCVIFVSKTSNHFLGQLKWRGWEGRGETIVK